MSTTTEAPPSGKLIVQDTSAISYLMDTSRFEHCYRIARLMASASLIPDHLKIDSKTKQMLPMETIAANCFMIVNQAFRWEFDPFGVAPETYVTGGKLAFQGKLVAAAINARAGLEERLNYTFEGAPGTDEFAVVVSGRIKGEKESRTVRVSVGQAKTQNDMWRKDPEQKLIYTGAIKWARRHTPEIILGVLIEDEVEETDLRQTTGRVVESGGNPYNDPRFARDPEPQPKAKGAKAAKEEAPAAEPQAEAPDQASMEVVSETGIPSVEDMVSDIREACAERSIQGVDASKIYRAAGLIPKGKNMATLTPEELFKVWKVRGVALDTATASTKGGDQ